MMKKIEFSLGLFGYVNSTTNSSTGNDLSPELKTFYDKALIELASPNLIHDQFGQKRRIPRNSGQSVEFRSFSSLPKVTEKLVEGITPSGNKLNVKSITCTPEAYGDYVQLSDVLEFTAVDNTILETTKKLADQAGRTLDTVVRNELNGGTNVMFCPAVENGTETEITVREDLKKSSLLTVKQIFKAVAELKAMNAPKINGYYIGIIHPYVSYDLIQDAGERWQNVSEYAKEGERYIGEIGSVGGVRFVETTEAKIFAPEKTLGGVRVATVTKGSEGESTIEIDAVCETVNNTAVNVYIGGEAYPVTKITKGSGKSTLTLGFGLYADAVGQTIYVHGGTKEGLSVFSTLILGADAYGVTELESGIENIIKQKGFGEDPLNQRCSIGWKAHKCAKRLVEEYMIRIESVSGISGDADPN